MSCGWAGSQSWGGGCSIVSLQGKSWRFCLEEGGSSRSSTGINSLHEEGTRQREEAHVLEPTRGLSPSCRVCRRCSPPSPEPDGTGRAHSELCSVGLPHGTIPSPPNSLKSSQPQMSFPGDSRGKEHGFLPARILEWVAIPFSKGIFLTPGGEPGLLHCRQSLYHWAEIVYIQSNHNHTHRNRLTQTHRDITHIYVHVCVVTDILRTPVIVLCCLYKICTLCLTFHVATVSEIGFTEVYLYIICTFVEVLIQWALMYPQLLHELHSRDIEFWASMVAQG